jgi:hypothetical protein
VRRANSVEGFYAGDISSKACGKSNPASALNAWTRTLRHSSRRGKFELLIAFLSASIASIKTRRCGLIVAAIVGIVPGASRRIVRYLSSLISPQRARRSLKAPLSVKVALFVMMSVY